MKIAELSSLGVGRMVLVPGGRGRVLMPMCCLHERKRAEHEGGGGHEVCVCVWLCMTVSAVSH